jgi:hypothetical protein
LHPSVQIIYAGSRKAAERWCAAWFAARAKDVRQREQDEPPPRGNSRTSPVGGQLIGEPPPLYGGALTSTEADTGEALRRLILSDSDLPGAFSIGDLREAFPGVSDGRIRSVLQALKREGRIDSSGAGRAARWRRV